MNSFSEHARSIICYVSIITVYNIAMHIMPYIYVQLFCHPKYSILYGALMIFLWLVVVKSE